MAMAMATNIATDWHERAAKWQFVALHGKPTSSALDRTKARRPAQAVGCKVCGMKKWVASGAGVAGGMSCRHLSHGHCMFEANLLQATARSRSCLGHQHLACLGFTSHHFSLFLLLAWPDHVRVALY